MSNPEKNRIVAQASIGWLLGILVVVAALALWGLSLVLKRGAEFVPTARQQTERLDDRQISGDPFGLSAACKNGKLVAQQPTLKRYPLNSLSDSAVLAWTRMAAPNLLTFAPSRAADGLLAQQAFFTSRGWCGYIKALTESKMLDLVAARHLGVTLNVTGDAELINRKQAGDVSVWSVRIPASILFSTEQKERSAPPPMTVFLSLTVESGDPLTQTKGPLISQAVFSPAP